MIALEEMLSTFGYVAITIHCELCTTLFGKKTGIENGEEIQDLQAFVKAAFNVADQGWNILFEQSGKVISYCGS